MTGLLPVAVHSQNFRSLFLYLTDLSTTLIAKLPSTTTVKPIMPHHLQPFLRHVPQRSLDELFRSQGHRFNLPIAMISVAKCHPLLIRTAQSLIRDRSPLDVARQIRHHPPSVTVALLDANIPLLAPELVEKILRLLRPHPIGQHKLPTPQGLPHP